MSTAYKDQKSFIDDLIREEDSKEPKTHYKEIAQMLNDRHYVDEEGRPWNYSTVRVYAVGRLGCTKRIHKRTKAEIAKDAEDAALLLLQKKEGAAPVETVTEVDIPEDVTFADTVAQAGILMKQGKSAEAGFWLEAGGAKEAERSKRSQQQHIRNNERLAALEGNPNVQAHILLPPQSPRDLLTHPATKRLTIHIDEYCLATGMYNLDSSQDIKGEVRRRIRDEIRENANSIVFADGKTYAFANKRNPQGGWDYGFEGHWNFNLVKWYNLGTIDQLPSIDKWDWMGVATHLNKINELVDYVINVQFPIPKAEESRVTVPPDTKKDDSDLPPF